MALRHSQRLVNRGDAEKIFITTHDTDGTDK